MERFNKVLSDESFRKRIRAIEEGETEREFCKHGMEHLMAVARIAYSLYLECYIDRKNSEDGKTTEMVQEESIVDLNDDIEWHFWDKDYMKEILYTTAILHDIGRCSNYEETMSHREAGTIIARPILTRAGFSYGEIDDICNAIRHHGTVPEDEGSLDGIIYRADKLSRECFNCDAEDDCNWDDSKKNSDLKY